MMTFLGNYLTTHMRSEAFYFTVGQSLLQYLSENGADIQKINTMDKEQNVYFLYIYIYIGNNRSTYKKSPRWGPNIRYDSTKCNRIRS